jgi:hypothetical protein
LGKVEIQIKKQDKMGSFAAGVKKKANQENFCIFKYAMVH